MSESLTTALPVISVPEASSFLPSIHEYMANLEAIPMAIPSLADSIRLLANSTRGKRALSQQTTNMLSDLFPSFRNLSGDSRTREGQKLLEDYFGESMKQEMVEFWKEDVLWD